MRSLSQHTFHELYLHINFHCFGNAPLISHTMEPMLHAFIRAYCHGLQGVYLEALGGVDDHLHLAMQVDPAWAPAEVIGKIKGSSARAMNQRFGSGALRWQRGYGVVSFAKRNLPGVVRYVENQRIHHGKGSIKAALEDYGADSSEFTDADWEEAR